MTSRRIYNFGMSSSGYRDYKSGKRFILHIMKHQRSHCGRRMPYQVNGIHKENAKFNICYDCRINMGIEDPIRVMPND